MSDLETVEDWKQHFEKQRWVLRELILDSDENLVDTEEFHRRLYVKYGITVEEDEDGSVHYGDPTAEWRSDRAKKDEVVESVISRESVPVTQGRTMIELDRHPDDLEDPEVRARKQVQFNEVVDREFERQLEEEDEPFPLEYPPDEPSDE